MRGGVQARSRLRRASVTSPRARRTSPSERRPSASSPTSRRRIHHFTYGAGGLFKGRLRLGRAPRPIGPSCSTRTLGRGNADLRRVVRHGRRRNEVVVRWRGPSWPPIPTRSSKVAVDLEHDDGRLERIAARRLMFALGRDGYGGARLPCLSFLRVAPRIGAGVAHGLRSISSGRKNPWASLRNLQGPAVESPSVGLGPLTAVVDRKRP